MSLRPRPNRTQTSLLRSKFLMQIRSPPIDMQVIACILSADRDRMKGDDKVFKALADPNRRKVLDVLCIKNGQTLGALCEHLNMKRQSATQHIDLLIDAN